MNIIIRLSLLALGCSSLIAAPKSKPSSQSSTWKDYVAARKTGQSPSIADFSYVGYQRGEKSIPKVAGRVFNVTNYGAIANDGLSDKEGIQQAINAARKNGGGVVFFPKGRFCVNQSGEAVDKGISINSSNIVLRGTGAGKGGTELYMHQALPAKDPQKMWTTPYIINFSAPYRKSKHLCSISAPSLAETKQVQVDDSSLLRPGDWVILKRIDKSKLAIQQALSPYQPDPRWTNITKGGVRVLEYHQIQSVSNRVVHFHEPIHYHVQPNAGWTLESYHPIQKVGVEDIAFVGNWKEKFVHHKSAIHDGGWSMLKLSKVAHGWVTRCRFTDTNCALFITQCANISATDLLLNGNKGHSAVSFNHSSHCFGGLIKDTAGHWHASGVGNCSSGNVFWRIQYRSDTCFESHASQPRHTLFDACKGGFIDGRWGGALANQPNHLEGLVFWNYKNTSRASHKPYEFVKSNSDWGRIIMPHVIGFHGGKVNFIEKQLSTLESNGAPVTPTSLYEAQLLNRIGSIPQWLRKLKRGAVHTD